MSDPRHDAIIATVADYVFESPDPEVPKPDIEAFRQSLPERWRHLLVGPVPSVVNHYRTYVFLPDGSKEGWEDSNDGDRYRKQFFDLFAFHYDDGSSPFDVVQVRFGGSEPAAKQERELTVTSNHGTTISSRRPDQPQGSPADGDYVVTWSIDISERHAETPRQAAQAAWDTIRRPDSAATTFTVFDGRDITEVDLSETETG